MFERHIVTEDFLTIPISANMYKINIHGCIKDSENQIIQTTTDSNGNLVAWLYLWNGWSYYSVAKLLAFTFKPTYVPFSLWNKLTVLFFDGNRQNIHPSNLVWKFSSNLESNKYKGYYYIPGYSRYVINISGEIINSLFGKKIKTSNSGGYLKCNILPDIGNALSIGIHRLLCLTFKDYPANIDKLDINHIDGNKSNNKLENLEWVTRKRNIQHAWTSGLINTNTEIYVKNIYTNEVTEYFSIKNCAESLNIPLQNVWKFSRDNKQPIHTRGLIFKRKNDSSPWRTIDDYKKELRHKGINRPIKVYNIITEEIYNYISIDSAGRDLNINSVNISHALSNPNCSRPLFIYSFKDKNDDTSWPIYSSDEIELFKQAFNRKKYFKGRGYKLIDIITKEIKLFAFLDDICNYTNVSQMSIIQAAKNNFKILNKWRVYFFY